MSFYTERYGPYIIGGTIASVNTAIQDSDAIQSVN